MFMIINESERNRIKSLYGLITEDTPPSESVLVANKNPFKYPEYESARRVYSSNLVDGDLYYEYYDEPNDDFGKKLISTHFTPLLVGKTMRGDNDVNYLIKEVQSWFRSYYDLKYPLNNKTNLYKLYIIYEDGFGSCLNVDPISKEVTNCPPTPNIPGLEKSGVMIKNPFQKQVNVNQKLINFIKSNIKKVERSEYPDDGFEIRKIQRQKTDF